MTSTSEAGGWRPVITGLVVIATIVSVPAFADRLRTELAPSTIEGTLWAAECMAASQVTPTCNRLALLEAKPAGLLTNKGYVVLLVDSRLLLRACPARTAQGRLRASGIHHAGAGAFTVFHLEEDCGSGWKVVDLPYSGVAGAGTEGGDE